MNIERTNNQDELASQPKKTRQKTMKELFESDGVKNALGAVAVGVLNPERMTAVAYQCVLKTPSLLDCNQNSLITALKTLAQMGCEPDGIHGYLVPHKLKTGVTVATPIPSARGLTRTARANGVKGINCGTVRVKDSFSWGNIDGMLSCNHSPDLWGCSDILGFFCTWFEGDLLRGVLMSKKEVDAIRSRSKAGNNGPWVTDYEQMAHKTVIKRASKQWDLPVQILDAMQVADEVEFEGMRNVSPKAKANSNSPVIDPTLPPEQFDDEIEDSQEFDEAPPEDIETLPNIPF